jgi:uncharacterized membrane protein YfcA
MVSPAVRFGLDAVGRALPRGRFACGFGVPAASLASCSPMTASTVERLVVLLIAVGSTLGGLLGARYGRGLPPLALRIFVVLIGIVSAVKLIFF